LPKATRADLHERFAAWLEERAPDLVELDELVGYHLEQAYAHRADLGAIDGEALSLGWRAADRLASAGVRALARGDMLGAAKLLRRAIELLPRDDPARLELLPELAAALIESGELARADSILEEAVETARSQSDERVEWRARVGRALVDVW